MDIWQPKDRPLMLLAPLHEVTDAAFRETVAACGEPDLMFTEFTSVDGLAHPKSREKIVRRYLQRYVGEERIAVQIWGDDPEKFRDAAALAKELGFAGVDLNTGCPDRTVVKNGKGGALLKDWQRILDLVAATIEGAGGLPVSVKTRLGFDRDVADDWIPALAGSGVRAITLHARTVKELSKVPAKWDRIRDLAPAVREKGVTFIGNGDVESYADGVRRVRESGCDGAMVGRAIFGNFWFFDPDRETADVPLGERLLVLADLADRFEARYGEFRSLSVLRKHVKGLVHGFEGASEIRERLMTCDSAAEFRAVALEHAQART